VELVIDHSVILERSGTAESFEQNVAIEYERNVERYTFLKWAQSSFEQFRVVPPGMGICHQVNLEHLARVVFEQDGVAYLDTLVGTDSHTTMVNGLGVLGWGVGGIEAEAGMLGQPTSMLIPPVVGLRLSGAPREGVTATDVVITITELLRKHGVVGKFVEAYGPGVASLSLETRATIGNMSPEYGATCAIFPIDQFTIDYLPSPVAPKEQLDLVEAYAKAQGLWHDTTRRAGLLRVRRTRPRDRRAESGRTQASPGPRVALGRARAFRDALGREPKEVHGVDMAETLREGASSWRRSRRAPTRRTLR
jgi:aconitate hydratase